MLRSLRLGLPVLLLAALVGCGPDYSPNTYSTAAVQQANKVDQGVIAGYREVAIRADGTVGAVTGGAAGGVMGAQAPEGGVVTALSAIGGTLIGGIVGTSVEHVAGDTKAFEYLVRKTGGDLISVTQKDANPLPVGLKVLVIEGKQARVVPDYSVLPEAPTPSGATARDEKKSGNKAEKSESADKADKSEKDVTAKPSAAPNVTSPAPAQAPPPTAVQTAPPPASAAAETSPTPPSPPSQLPEAAAPPVGPSSAAAPQSAPADQSQSPTQSDPAGPTPSVTNAATPAPTPASAASPPPP